MAMIKVDKWCIVEGYMDRIRLAGFVADGSLKGRHIVTSYIVDVEGREVKTKSGSTYRLGKIDPNYRKWLKTDRPNWDWRNPIKKMF